MNRMEILAPIGEGFMVEKILVTFSVAILSVALLMLIAVFQPTIFQSKMSQSTTTVVHAGPPTNVTGIWACMKTFPKKINQDGNIFISGDEESLWSGTFEGISDDSFTKTMYLSNSMTYNGQIDFIGKVNNKIGTLVILFLCKGQRKDGSWVFGQWWILIGTGDLANLHGGGSYWGWWGSSLIYTGQIYFE